MVKICKVIQNNQYVTVVRFNGMEIQFPSIKRETDTVKVLAKDGKYTIVADDYVEKELYIVFIIRGIYHLILVCFPFLFAFYER